MIKKILAFFSVCIFAPTALFAAISSECERFTDCDTLVACELALQVESAALGLGVDYNGAAAQAIQYRDACKNYPDQFKNNINVKVSDNPEITVNLNWDTVRQRMRYGSQGGLVETDLQLIQLIVDIFGPDTEAQKKFFEALATAYVNANKTDETIRLNDAFVLDFLGTDDNFEKYRTAVRDLTGETVNADLGIDVNWDDVLTEISVVLDQAQQKRGVIVCENNRSYQLGIDVAGWVVTAVAAVATFFTGGAGGAAVAAGRAAIGAGLKAAAKATAKVGGKAAAKRMSKAGGKQLAKSAVKLGLKQNMRGYVNYAGKGVLKTGVKNYTKAIGANLKNKWILLGASSAAIWGLGNATTTGGTTLYSLLSSALDKEFLNCQGVDHNEGCYTVCGDGTGDDYINQHALKPVLGKTYCVNPKDYALYEINPDGTRGKLLTFDANKQSAILSRIKQHVQDKGTGSTFSRGKGCDFNEDDIDMYFGFYIYDPDTLEISNEAMVIDDAIRLDE